MREFYLVLERVGRARRFKVRIAETLSAAIEGWQSSTRVSPLFTQNAELDPSIPSPGFIYFLSLAHPQTVSERIPADIQLWLSTGLFNVVVATVDREPVKNLLDWCEESDVPVEEWAIGEGGWITQYRWKKRWPRDKELLRSIAQASEIVTATELAEAIREYCPLIASGISRASRFFPQVVEDLHDIHADVATTLSESTPADDDEHIYELLGDLTVLNAGLSRFTSQTLSGTSPISETECHYWVHSLLGTGLANVALWRFCRFILRILGELRLPSRVEHFLELPPCRLEGLDDRDEFWYQTDHLHSVELTATDTAEELVPFVTFFSGRDGFKSTLQSLSAPLAVIGACNSLRWTMLTLTHEISHIYVRGALGVLYPTRESAPAAYQLINREPSNLLESIQRYLIRTVGAMQEVEDERSPQLSSTNIADLLERWHDDVEEMMVHAFDFMYFYRRDTERYVRGIWLSWSTIPNIANRVPEYVLRSILAVLALHLRRGPDIEAAARDQVRRVLQSLKEEEHGGLYIDQAINFIDTQWSTLQMRLIARRGLVRIVQTFLFSERTATQMLGELHLIGGESDTAGYPHRVGAFSTDPISNPLRFTESFTKVVQPDAAASLWMLAMLALNGSDADA